MKFIPIYNFNIHAPQTAEDGIFPDTPGIYIAFACKRFRGASIDLVLPTRPIYIGMSENTGDNEGIRGRIADHLQCDHAKWQAALPEDIEIQYGYIDGTIQPSIETVEAAIINVNKPQFNVEYKDHLPYQINAVLRFTGSIGALAPEIKPVDLNIPQ